MYDELIAELRQHHCDAKEDDTQEVCEECAYDVIIADESVPSGIASVCVCGLMNRAADAIEELQADKAALNGTVTNLLEQIKDFGKPRWIPVSERLPSAHELVLVYNPGYLMSTGFMYEDGRWRVRSIDYPGTPTYWMPLPEPPKEES